MPQTPHYAVLVYKVRRITIPGDERSRTHPGHGYPEHTDEINATEHWVTTDLDELSKFVYDLDQKATPYVFFEVARLGKLRVQIDLAVE